MRVSFFALPLLLIPSLTVAQDRGVALNMGRGLDNGMSVGWTFKENWTLRPTLGAGYSQQSGFQASIGSTVLRSFGYGHRVYGYAGAGIYYGSANTGVNSAFGGPGQNQRGTGVNSLNNSLYRAANIAYVTAPVGLRARLYGNFEAFAETAYQRTLSGQFGLSQTGQFSGNGRARLGATFGVTMRLQ
ncbi:MAG: hypothetical protein ABI565_06420 [Vicinamibacteria bacterium]